MVANLQVCYDDLTECLNVRNVYIMMVGAFTICTFSGLQQRPKGSFLSFPHLSEPVVNQSYQKMTIPDEVDIIVVGGGSAGCVSAGRLANLDHNLQVLLIEAGEDNLNNPQYVNITGVLTTC